MQSHSHQSRVFINIISIFLCFSAIQSETFPENYSHTSQDFTLIASQRRFARQRCLQQYPHADALGFRDTADTHCFLQCLLLKMGLMDLRTRGLDASKFLDIWDDIEEASEEKCMFRFALDEPLSGTCSDCYRKLMEFRSHCFALFEHTFAVGSTLGAKESNQTSKLAGQSASEFCGSLDDEADPVTETSASIEITFLSHYKRKLECLFQNYHYIDAYGRVDESEILLSYQEVRLDSKEARAAIKMCTQHANAKFQRDDSGDLVFELQTCLKQHSPEFAIVSQRRDELSKDY